MDQEEKANQPGEILDLVNGNDEIIGEVIRKDANSNPKLTHREIAVIIVDDKNRILLQKRSGFKTVNPLMWSVTAGHILKGDEALGTAHIELKEKLGFDTDLVFIKKVLHKYPWESHFMNYFLGKYNNEEVKIEKAEVEETRFFSKAELENFIKKGGDVNLKHLEIFNDYWQGEFSK
ncbi:NUDIX domain-containing protein [Patescibacteria group bacterium]|nr:NUDIX domain-containing protein [Patescibacteria group bacterium]